jgi:hypothetical protein
MNTKIKTAVKLIAITASVAAFASGCSGGKVTVKTNTPVIVYYGGYYGYYTNNVFCDWANNYCGTALAYGIYDNGLGYGGSTGSYGSTGSTGGVTYGSSGSGGTTYGSSGSSGTTYGSSGSSGTTYGSSGSSGTTYGSSGSSGSTYSGSSGSYSGSSGSYSGSSGSYSGSSGSYSGSSGSYGSSGSSGYSFDNNAAAPVNAQTLAANGCSDLANCVSGATQFAAQAANLTDSVDAATRDTDLQQADLQQADVAARAQSVSTQFQMNYTAAVQLTQLSDKVQAMTKAGSMTSEDREAITESALGVAGIGTDDVNTAIAATLKGDTTAIDALMDKAATNLGMPSSAGLREQILPALGINLGAAN